MLSALLVDHLARKGWWFDDATDDYRNALSTLGVDESSQFGQFYLHAEDGPTFNGRNREIYQICWFLVNSNDYSASVARTHDALKLPSEYLPLDNFQGEYGFFYNKNSEEVLRLGSGAEWRDFQEGKLLPQWADFSSFLEWYFGLTE
ncbi:hypothetical protein GS966_23340 [Rhodococcus hoagii]|nr:hypothetical protein [Prescottella equi]NKS73489.1 hypothetical protein [Prescottella equi]NKZ92861.1 hypothetical protein [Prescottella equi]